jgi:hypothetical protein
VPRDKRRCEVDYYIHRPERFAHGADDLVRLPRIKLGGGDLRTAQSITHGHGVSEFTAPEKNTGHAGLISENGRTGSALSSSADNQMFLIGAPLL